MKGSVGLDGRFSDLHLFTLSRERTRNYEKSLYIEVSVLTFIKEGLKNTIVIIIIAVAVASLLLLLVLLLLSLLLLFPFSWLLFLLP